MRFKIMSVYDQKAKAYLPPFYLPNTALGVRAFRDAVNEPGHAFQKNPEDYVLFALGEFDDETGAFSTLPAPLLLVNGLQCVRLEEEVKVNANA